MNSISIERWKGLKKYVERSRDFAMDFYESPNSAKCYKNILSQMEIIERISEREDDEARGRRTMSISFTDALQIYLDKYLEEAEEGKKAFMEHLEHRRNYDQSAKADEGKAKISFVPPQIVYDIAEVREYGNRKYGDPENWRTVEVRRYIDALGRHYLEMLKDPKGKDPESGIEHYKHIACNAAFICELLKEAEE